VRLNLLSLITARVSSLLFGRAPDGWLRCVAASSSAILCMAAAMRACRSTSSLLRKLAASSCTAAQEHKAAASAQVGRASMKGIQA
jgi:hypothetical protein